MSNLENTFLSSPDAAKYLKISKLYQIIAKNKVKQSNSPNGGRYNYSARRRKDRKIVCFECRFINTFIFLMIWSIKYVLNFRTRNNEKMKLILNQVLLYGFNGLDLCSLSKTMRRIWRGYEQSFRLISNF